MPRLRAAVLTPLLSGCSALLLSRWLLPLPCWRILCKQLACCDAGRLAVAVQKGLLQLLHLMLQMRIAAMGVTCVILGLALAIQ
jgi:hypothetical protein